MPEHYVCFVTAPPQEAPNLARKLVEARLVACVNLIPAVSSTYWWEGRVQEDQEALLVLKTSADSVEALVQKVKELHSYTVPEVIAMPIERGNPDYLQWIRQSVG
ncbi:MAG: divalent-cation tolerance protein CutA [Armatimonadetes bacterium]|nr:divalent-cation tolerance protein CutA [Armatimonadota bacterium]